jgi:hypothetical protein
MARPGARNWAGLDEEGELRCEDVQPQMFGPHLKDVNTATLISRRRRADRGQRRPSMRAVRSDRTPTDRGKRPAMDRAMSGLAMGRVSLTSQAGAMPSDTVEGPRRAIHRGVFREWPRRSGIAMRAECLEYSHRSGLIYPRHPAGRQMAKRDAIVT